LGGSCLRWTTDRSSSLAAAAAVAAERLGMAGRLVVGLIKVLSLPAVEILYGKECAASPSLSSSLLMMATAAAKVNAYLHRGAVMLPRRQIHGLLL
jgi:hypothetical protein